MSAVGGTSRNGTKPLLALSGLQVTKEEGSLLVDGVSLEVGVGEAVAVVGESGSGKSLTARASVGLLPRGLTATGSIRYRGQELVGMSERSRSRMRGAEVTMILQDPFTMLHPMLRCGNLITETLRGENGRGPRRQQRREEAGGRLPRGG